MALADTSRAIAAALRLLRSKLGTLSGVNVSVGRIEATGSNPRLNLVAYEADFSPGLRNDVLDEGQPPPTFLTLRGLMTAFDTGGNTDTLGAHEVLGAGMIALQSMGELSLEGLSGQDLAALSPSPEPLKVAVTAPSADVLSSVMQGTDEKYRFSMAFELGPIMLASPGEGEYGLLVGVDYTLDAIAPEPIGLKFLTRPFPRITGVTPSRASLGESLTVRGEDFEARTLVATLAGVDLPAIDEADGSLTVPLDPSLLLPDRVSPGEHGLVIQELASSGRRRASNMVVVGLLPTVTSAVVSGVSAVDPLDSSLGFTAQIDVAGTLLGKSTDDAFLALYREGATTRMFDDLADTSPSPGSQTGRRVVIPDSLAVPRGDYRVIVRVNGRQAAASPLITI